MIWCLEISRRLVAERSSVISRAAYLLYSALTTSDHPPSRGAHTKELAVYTCEAAHSFRWPAMVVRCALATALVSTPEFALLSQWLTHASRTC